MPLPYDKYTGSLAFRLMVYVSGFLVMPSYIPCWWVKVCNSAIHTELKHILHTGRFWWKPFQYGYIYTMASATLKNTLPRNSKLVHLSSMNLVPTSAESVNWPEAAVLSFVYTNFHSPMTFGGFNSPGYYVASSLKSSVVARVCPLKCHMKSPG